MIQFFTYIWESNGEDYIFEILGNLGYLKNLQNERSRVFALSVHSDQPLSMKSCDTLVRLDIEFYSNELLIEKYGREIYSNGPLKILCIFHE